ncbi:hypothetical protein CAPTEDRAFT_3638 [Capitella teleta]|uniref:BTB domain-containing protein n=1 Tax=Capitella teleta TaxID=283909 RepID=R7TJ24_CAPTE|nr:hypothetical protein CAPTEDRAFT_3638 [Capitella teleta]|eukprot:ELT91551.1 hypothetical protein CAPTEDRAFT_3638 [Capitella teleta]
MVAAPTEEEEENTNCEDFLFIEASHALQVLSGLNELRQGSLFCDLTLCIERKKFPCHKIVLASFSPYFKGMFSSDLAESKQDAVILNGVEADMIELLINYAYTSEICVTKSNVQSLLSAANLLEILPVRDACCRFMERHMDESNCLGIHCFAETHACIDLQQKAKLFTLRHFADVCQQDEFVNLSQAKLTELISEDALCVENEEVVFNSVCRWLEHDPSCRIERFPQVMEHVRLSLLSPYFLHDCVDDHPVIGKLAKCQELIKEANTYHLLKDRRHELRTPRSRPRLSTGTMEVIIAVGGEDDKVVLRSVESFDPITKHWKTLACLPFAVSKHGLVVNASRSMWRYDPCFDCWQEMASMILPRSELGLAMLDGFIFAVGGWEGSSRLDSIERYDPTTNHWSMVAPMKMAVTSPAVVAHEGLLYVTGGAVLEDGDGIDLVQCFNPRNNHWMELPRMKIARSGSAACALNSVIYVIGEMGCLVLLIHKIYDYLMAF